METQKSVRDHFIISARGWSFDQSLSEQEVKSSKCARLISPMVRHPPLPNHNLFFLRRQREISPLCASRAGEVELALTFHSIYLLLDAAQ